VGKEGALTRAAGTNELVSIWDQTDLLNRIMSEQEAAVPEVARAFTVAGLATRAPTLVVVLSRSRDAEAFAEALGVWMDPAEIVLYPAWEALPGEAISPTLQTMGRRIKVLRDLALGTYPKVIVTSVRAAVQEVPEPPLEAIRLAPGIELSLDQIVDRLVDYGFERNYLVERPGEFAVRGGILDIFPADGQGPFRADFFSDEITDLRRFSASSQRSGKELDAAEVTPCRELRLTAEVRKRASAIMDQEPPGSDRYEDLERLANGVNFPGMEAYLSSVAGPLSKLTDFLPELGRVVLSDPKQCRDRASDFLEQAESWGGEQSKGLFVDLDEIASRSGTIELWPYRRAESGVDLDVAGWDEYTGRIEALAERCRELIKAGTTIVVAGGRSTTRAREILADAGLGLPIGSPRPGEAAITEKTVARGFVLRFDGRPILAVVGEADLFGRRRPVAASVVQAPARATALLLQLAPDDYVVHEIYGVGKYHGMVTREVAGVSRDYLLISYHGDDRLYLPTEQLEAITKYTGGETPRLNRLGSTEWEKSKSKARRAVQDIAQELITLYSKRLRAEGHAFPPDTPWQAELENSFLYVETPDQARAIEAVKEDMEKLIPMDRLVCGDVGYGKTEVAVRAVFKAVQDSKQAAVLVPTTILAQQHHQTFTERFAGFPVKVAQLSRFLTAGEQSEVLEEIVTGKVDVVVGTHRLLQPDVKFQDLGLLVVDEEQRFGVKHKEKIKHLREKVDVLTMTATPIPRTLEMGVTGIRDLSLMDTAPMDRRPVLTYVGDYDERMVKAAIRRELARDGQVFLVHNRVRSIAASTRRIAALVPGARVAVAHGQMSETELERVMVDVWDGKVDVLVCTTIIESGLDIPAMNTLIVERADLLGLAQLYQLRGRVGRAAERAYAYFFYPHETVLTDEAHERLKTLSEYTDLGSGFKIALRDLEMRGAGNLLGAEQSGHIAAVGFDLYMRMMTEAISELTGRLPESRPRIRLDIPADAYIPAYYIERESLRMDAYRQIDRVRTADDVRDLQDEFADLYGEVPKPLQNLLIVAELKAFLADQGVAEATVRNGVLKLKPFPELTESQQLRLRRLFSSAVYKPASGTLLLDVPAEDVAAWVLASLRAILSVG
jgi:transcription-repair coupling factor (superfamily II helicase)